MMRVVMIIEMSRQVNEEVSRDVTSEADGKNQGVDSRDGVMHIKTLLRRTSRNHQDCMCSFTVCLCSSSVLLTDGCLPRPSMFAKKRARNSSQNRSVAYTQGFHEKRFANPTSRT